MKPATKPIPDGYTAVTPYLIAAGAARAIDWYKRVFDATEELRIPAPGDKIGHAELRIGGARIMLADEHPEMDARGPRSFGGSPVGFLLYVTDVDATFARAVEAGAKVVQKVEDKFYGDRTGGIEDPFGHKWYISTHKFDMTPEELAAAAKQG